jgi:hypothetical protein
MLPAPRNNTFPELLTTTPILEAFSPSSSSSSSSSSEDGMFSSWWVMLFMLILLICLGFFIYYYLAKGALPSTNEFLLDILAYIKIFFNYNPIGGPTLSQINENGDRDGNDDESEEHSENADGGDSTEKQREVPPVETPPNTASLSKITPSNNEVRPPDNSQQNALNRALNASKPQESPKEDYVANDSYSSKAGWCYIGSEQGYRSCSQVGEADTCMSGNIFPTQDICVNPSLRT